jgi:methionyl-tRNA formyltransferase
MMRVVFMGSAPISCPALKALASAADVDVVGVVTQPDRPKGRRRVVSPGVVKALAEELGLRVLCPPKVNDAESVEAIGKLSPDLIVVVAYGQILRKAILDPRPAPAGMPQHPCLAAAALPRGRAHPPGRGQR